MTNVLVNRLDKTYDASAERTFAAILSAAGGVGLARAGRRPDGGLVVTVGGTPETATVSPGSGYVVDTTAGITGSYAFTLTASTGVSLAARPASGTSRIDVLVMRIKNSDVHIGDGAVDGDVVLIPGTAGASPTAPSIQANDLKLAELNVPASGTVGISKLAPRIAALGGVIPCASQAERDAISPVYDGLAVYREDLDLFEDRVNGAWTARRDSGWTDLTLGTGWTNLGSSDTTRAIRSNGMATVCISAVKASYGSGDVIATLPAGFRPSGGNVRLRVTGHWNGSFRVASVLTDGSGQIVADAAGTGGFFGTLAAFPIGA